MNAMKQDSSNFAMLSNAAFKKNYLLSAEKTVDCMPLILNKEELEEITREMSSTQFNSTKLSIASNLSRHEYCIDTSKFNKRIMHPKDCGS